MSIRRLGLRRRNSAGTGRNTAGPADRNPNNYATVDKAERFYSKTARRLRRVDGGPSSSWPAQGGCPGLAGLISAKA